MKQYYLEKNKINKEQKLILTFDTNEQTNI